MLVFALIVSSLLALGQCLPTSMSDECQLGPSHWCRDKQTATMCGVLAYCRLHNAAFTAKAASTPLMDVIEITRKENHPVHLVKLMERIKFHASNQSKSSPNDMCAECKQYVGEADLLLKDEATQQEILAVMDHACGLLPASVSSVCSGLVTIYGQQAIDNLVNYLADPAQFCGTIGVCLSEAKSVPLPRLSTPRIFCATCETLVGYAGRLLENKANQQKVISMMSLGCSLLPSSASGICKEMVANYSQQIIKALIQDLTDPKELCIKLKLCPHQGFLCVT